MDGVVEVKQLDDQRLQWWAQVGGKEKTWEAVITEQIPDARIAWRETEGAKNSGVVTFHRLSDDTTRVMVQMEYDPEGFVETVGDLAYRKASQTIEGLSQPVTQLGGEGADLTQLPGIGTSMANHVREIVETDRLAALHYFSGSQAHNVAVRKLEQFSVGLTTIATMFEPPPRIVRGNPLQPFRQRGV